MSQDINKIKKINRPTEMEEQKKKKLRILDNFI